MPIRRKNVFSIVTKLCTRIRNILDEGKSWVKEASRVIAVSIRQKDKKPKLYLSIVATMITREFFLGKKDYHS